MKAVVTNFNLLTWTRGLCKNLERLKGVDEIVILDNASTYEPLLDWYSDCGYTVERFAENYGHHALLTAYSPEKLGDYFIHTDPDLDLNEIPEDTVDILKIPYLANQSCIKSGLSIRLDDIPQNAILNKPCRATAGNTIFQHESMFYTHPVMLGDHQFYSAAIDTTFYLSRTKYWRSLRNIVPGFRAAAPYRCRHMPFYYTEKIEDPEFLNYLQTCNRSASYAPDLR